MMNWKWPLIIGGVFLAIFIVILSLDKTDTIFHEEPTENKTDIAIYFFDVGEGDAILIDCQAEEILIDTGPMGCGIADMIKPYVDGTLDGVVLTHPHKEAVGDLREVLAAYTVRTVWKNTDTAGSGPYVDAMGMLDSDHLEVLTQPCMIGTNNIKLSVLNAAWGSDLDDNSLVIELMTKAGRFLFMGDAGKATEERLVANETLLPCKVLKVANHGADTATFANFLEVVQPKDAIYTGSTASPSVIARLDFESDVYSINETGMLTIKIQGNKYIIERSK